VLCPLGGRLLGTYSLLLRLAVPLVGGVRVDGGNAVDASGGIGDSALRRDETARTSAEVVMSAGL
jgi:hypothetical protein